MMKPLDFILAIALLMFFGIPAIVESIEISYGLTVGFYYKLAYVGIYLLFMCWILFMATKTRKK